MIFTPTSQRSLCSDPTSAGLQSVIRARPTTIQWDQSLPVFAKEEFLKAVGDEYGWLGGYDPSGELRCILPYTIVRKCGLRLVRFRIETIPCDGGLDVTQEKVFLNSVVQYFRDRRADVIIPATNNALFRTYPDGAQQAPYGTYVIDLRQPAETLWHNISKTTRHDISAAERDGVVIREGRDYVESAHSIVRDTFARSGMAFMSLACFRRFVEGLGENCKVLAAEHNGVIQAHGVFAFSSPRAYWIYGGSIGHAHRGAMKLLQWEAIRLFHSLGIQTFDFFGARLNPAKGSKQESINLMKKRFGASLAQGYMWKYALRPWRASVYSTGVTLLRGGDVVDQEAHTLNSGRRR